MENSAFRLKERLKRLYVVVDRMEKNEGSVPQVEIDLLLEELRGMYADTLLLNAPQSIPWEVAPSQNEAPTEEESLVDNQPSESAPQPVVEPKVEEPHTDAVIDEHPLTESVAERVEEMPPIAEPQPQQAKPAEEISLGEVVAPAVAASSALHVAEALADMGSLQFASESAAPESTAEVAPQTSLEELEGNKNDELFQEETPVAALQEETPAPVAPEPQPAPEVKSIGEQVEAPKTVWEQLQSQRSAPTLADMFQAEEASTPKETIIPKETPSPKETPAPVESVSPWSVDPIIAEAQHQAQQHQVQQPRPEEVTRPIATPQPAQPVSPVQKEQPVVSQPHHAEPTSPSLLDLLRQSNASEPSSAEHHRTLGESFGHASETNTESHIGRPKVSDLRTVININDKFSFMSELFHNNMKAYNDFILRLNAINDRDEAYAYVADISNQYGWVGDSLAVQTFFSVLERKF